MVLNINRPDSTALAHDPEKVQTTSLTKYSKQWHLKETGGTQSIIVGLKARRARCRVPRTSQILDAFLLNRQLW